MNSCLIYVNVNCTDLWAAALLVGKARISRRLCIACIENWEYIHKQMRYNCMKLLLLVLLQDLQLQVAVDW
jgi:hypothetical protein